MYYKNLYYAQNFQKKHMTKTLSPETTPQAIKFD